MTTTCVTQAALLLQDEYVEKQVVIDTLKQYPSLAVDYHPSCHFTTDFYKYLIDVGVPLRNFTTVIWYTTQMTLRHGRQQDINRLKDLVDLGLSCCFKYFPYMEFEMLWKKHPDLASYCKIMKS